MHVSPEYRRLSESRSGKGVRGLKGRTVELSWWEWSLFRLVVFLITAPVVVAAVYLIFRKRGP